MNWLEERRRGERCGPPSLEAGLPQATRLPLDWPLHPHSAPLSQPKPVLLGLTLPLHGLLVRLVRAPPRALGRQRPHDTGEALAWAPFLGGVTYCFGLLRRSLQPAMAQPLPRRLSKGPQLRRHRRLRGHLA